MLIEFYGKNNKKPKQKQCCFGSYYRYFASSIQIFCLVKEVLKRLISFCLLPALQTQRVTEADDNNQ